MALNYLTIIIDSVFSGILGVLLTQGIFFVIARIFNYDFVFPIETGRHVLDISEDFYSNTYAGIRGLFVHIGIGLVIMFFYSLLYVNLIGIIFFMGPYTYGTPQGTAIMENLFWLVILGFLIYGGFYLRDKNFDRFSIFLFVYLMTLVSIMGVIFGLYLFGAPGTLG